MDTPQHPDITFKPLFKLTTDGHEDLQIAACDTCGALIPWNANDTNWIKKHGQHHTQKDTHQ